MEQLTGHRWVLIQGDVSVLSRACPQLLAVRCREMVCRSIVLHTHCCVMIMHLRETFCCATMLGKLYCVCSNTPVSCLRL